MSRNLTVLASVLILTVGLNFPVAYSVISNGSLEKSQFTKKQRKEIDKRAKRKAKQYVNQKLLLIDTEEIANEAVTTPKIETGAVTSSEIATGAVTASKLAADAITMPFTVYAFDDQTKKIESVDEVRAVTLAIPADGTVVVTSSANIYDNSAGDGVRCSLTTGDKIDTTVAHEWYSGGSGASEYGTLAMVRGFDVAAGDTLTVNLICESFDDSFVYDSGLVATYTPS